MPRIEMSVEDAKKIVSETLAAHGNEIELRDLLNALPDRVRPLVARMFSELRKQGAFKTELTVENGEVRHLITPPESSGGDA